MAFLERRIRKAEESMSNLDPGIEEYKAALKRWYSGKSEFCPEPPSSLGTPGNLNWAEARILALYELEKEAKLEGREFKPCFGS